MREQAGSAKPTAADVAAQLSSSWPRLLSAAAAVASGAKWEVEVKEVVVCLALCFFIPVLSSRQNLHSSLMTLNLRKNGVRSTSVSCALSCIAFAFSTSLTLHEASSTFSSKETERKGEGRVAVVAVVVVAVIVKAREMANNSNDSVLLIFVSGSK